MNDNSFFPSKPNVPARRSSGLPMAWEKAAEPSAPVGNNIKTVQPGQAIPCVVILTALPEEFLAVERHVKNPQEKQHTVGTVYSCGQFDSGYGVWNVAIVETGKGNTSAADETQRAVAHFEPDVVMFVGVAGGLKEAGIGDVVAGTKVYNYESGKDEEVFRPRPEVGRSTYDMEQISRAVVRDWLRRRSDDTDTSKSLPKAFAKPIAAGEAVIASSKSITAKRLKHNYGDALAVEMEGYGFLEAARKIQGLSAVVIRGISDALDGKAETDAAGSQELAAEHASQFAFDVLRKLDTLRGQSEDSSHSFVVNPGEGDRSAQADESTTVQEDDVIEVDLERQFPEEVAIVYVEERSGELTLKAFNARQTSLEPSKPSPMPSAISLSGLLASKNSLDIIGQLKSYRPRTCAIGQFFGWLRELRKTLCQESETSLSCLIINDRTKFDLPWELLHLPKKETLGTITQVIHWHDVEDPDTWELISLPTPQKQANRCRGNVLIYADTEEAITTRCGLTLLQKYRKLQFTDSKRFLEHWQQTDAELGLIYLTGQGFQDMSLNELKARLSYTASLQSRPSIVFIDMYLPAGGESMMTYSQLATAFLENGVKGVVGRLGIVRDEQAASIVDSFFVQHHLDRNAPIPELLRRLRLEALQRLYTAFNEENCLLYLTTCLYAYSGNQMTVLELAAAEDVNHG